MQKEKFKAKINSYLGLIQEKINLEEQGRENFILTLEIGVKSSHL
jgi:hypothetical protein